MQTTAGWFGGDRPPDAREAAFVEALRRVATRWQFADLGPEDTTTAGHAIGRLVEVRVPQLSAPRRILRVLYELDAGGLPALRSEWTAFEYPFEGSGFEEPDPETDLWVSGVDASPEQCGRWVAAWFARQLRRPIKRREWDRPASGLSTLVPGSTSGPAFVQWVVGEPEQQLDDRGGLRWWWSKQQPPSREVWERRGPSAATEQTTREH